MFNLFEDQRLRLLFFGGKGGVGKTTCAAAAALRLARSSPLRSFLLVSTDPAHSLADSLADLIPPPNLKILEFNARESFTAFREQHRQKLREIAARGTFLDDQDISRLLDLSWPGLDELMALIEISRRAEQYRDEVIIVDTAPTGHTLKLLTSPRLIRGWLKALDALLAKHRFMQNRFQGSYRPDHLDDFLLELARATKQMEKMLRHSHACRFVPVMLAEELSLRETETLLDELERLQIPVKEIVVNRLYPESRCPECSAGRSQQLKLLKGLSGKGQRSGYTLGAVPLYPEEIRGAQLETFWEGLTELPLEARIPTGAPLFLAPRVEAAPPAPPPETSFLIFAGKGGVGKTTLACATALRLARDFPGKEVLLFSTDPAHSLSACLDLPLGPRPPGVLPGLTAMEVDAAAEFSSLKKHFQEELEEFLGSVFHHVDPSFDRRVMEELLELSPPGLDEIMALTRTLGLLNRYDILILDSAPTGHLLRLLQLPEIIDQWLKSFFGLLLKYRLVFRLPELSQRLVRISRDLKLLKSCWSDPARSALYAVSILTEMAFQETRDLVATCERLGISVPVLFLNLATPGRDCALCSSVNRRESRILGEFQRTFTDQHLSLIYRQDEPRGLRRLEELGQTLYRPTAVREKLPEALVDKAAPG